MATIADEQLRQLSEIADEIDRLMIAAERLAMPPSYRLKQLRRALPGLSERIRALSTAIGGDPWDAPIEARF